MKFTLPPGIRKMQPWLSLGGDGHVPSASSSRRDKTQTPATVPVFHCRELTGRGAHDPSPRNISCVRRASQLAEGTLHVTYLLPCQAKSSHLQAELSKGQKRARWKALTNNAMELFCQEKLKNISQSCWASSSLFSARDLEEKNTTTLLLVKYR